MRTLTETDVQLLLNPRPVIGAIEEAFRERYPYTVMPPRTHMDLGAKGVFLVMSCYDASGRALGMKLVLVPSERGKSLQATYLLFDTETGRPSLMLPANTMTDLRTAAVSAVATKFLARPDARVLGIFGAGRQARAHLQLLPLVRKFERFLACASTEARSREFAREMSLLLEKPVEPVDARGCAAESDVICTCTTSKEPLFDGKLVRPGTHLNLVGAFQPGTREVDDFTVQSSRVVVDTYEGALAEAGDLLIPMNSGVIGQEHIRADLHELVSHKKRPRTSNSDITLFKSVGCALEDLVTAELIQRALGGTA
jgi:ornithine cyclodeaminase/alanine dehydrogenase-like protein (mu-crystallin family)